jgi:hypothetical protein
MARVKLDIGAVVDFVTKDEMDESLEKHRIEGDKLAQGYSKGIKYFRLPRMYGAPVTGTLRLGEATTAGAMSGPYCGPAEGYLWSIRRLTINGLGTGTLPDIVNFYRSGFSADPVWQLNGNSWGATFGKTEMVLLGGEFLLAKSVGSMTATATITVQGDVIEVPAEMIGKLVR